jgi:hypothetical protein
MHAKVYGFKHSFNFWKMQETLQKEIPNHNDPFHNHISEFWKFVSKLYLFHNYLI